MEKSGVSKAAHDLGYLSKALFLARASLIRGFSDYASLGRSLPCTLVLYLGCSRVLLGFLKLDPLRKSRPFVLGRCCRQTRTRCLSSILTLAKFSLRIYQQEVHKPCNNLTFPQSLHPQAISTHIQRQNLSSSPPPG